MIALMALWFGRCAGLPSDGGYFYLCPSCYAEHVEPNLEEVLNRLVEQHPFLHRLRGDHEPAPLHPMPLRQAGALPVPHDVPAPRPAPALIEPPAAAESPSPPSPLPPDAAA